MSEQVLPDGAGPRATTGEIACGVADGVVVTAGEPVGAEGLPVPIGELVAAGEPVVKPGEPAENARFFHAAVLSAADRMLCKWTGSYTWAKC